MNNVSSPQLVGFLESNMRRKCIVLHEIW